VLRTAGVIALAVVFGVGMSACYLASTPLPGAGEDTDTDTDTDEELVEKVIFNLQDSDAGMVSHEIQELTVGTLSFAGDANPMAPLVRAGGDSSITIEAVDNDGKIALKFTTVDSWGAGIDMPHSKFGFREGDNIKITGELIAGAKTQLNFTLGSENAHGTAIESAGPISWDIDLTSTQVSQIAAGDPASLRIEGRPGGAIVRVDNIIITGMRPSTIAKLATPVVTLTGGTISWPAVTGAGGYKVFEGTNELESLLADELSYNLATSDLVPGGPYTITVVALGVSGSSTDSDPSTPVNYTKPVPPPPFNVTFTQAMLDDTLASQGTATLYTSGASTGYTWTADTTTGSWGGGYACFQVTLPDPLSAFIQLKFTYNKISGDTEYKSVTLYAATTAIGGYGGSGATVLAAPSGNTVSGGVNQEITLTIDPVTAATISATTVYIAIGIPMATTGAVSGADTTSSYTIYDVSFIR